MKLLHVLGDSFNNISIRKKLLLSYIFVVFLPVCIVGIMLTSEWRKTTLEMAVKETSANVEKVKKRVEEILKIPVDVSTKLYFDRDLRGIISSKYERRLDIVKAYNNYNEFDEFKNLYKEIKYIRFYVFNKDMLYNWQFMQALPDIKNRNWFIKAVQLNGKISWHYTYNDNRKQYFLSLTRMMVDDTGKKAGVLVIDVNTDYLNSVLKEEMFETMFIDGSGNIIAAKDMTINGLNEEQLALEWYSPDDNSNISDVEYEGMRSKAVISTFSPSRDSRFKILSIFPVDNIVRDARRTSILGMTVVVSSLLFSFVIIFIFSNALSKRIKQLSSDIHTVAGGDFNMVSRIKGNDEIGKLAADINIMAKNLKELVHEVYESNLQKKQLLIKQMDIKLKMLANQINPHFLFNALESIRMKAHLRGEREISAIIKMLSKIMRRNLSISNELVSVKDELEIVKSYLKIQKFRFEDRINFFINIQSGLSNYKILPLLIQPIVENSVIHGLEGKVENGLVTVDIRKNNDILIIEIKDNGVGINGDKLDKIRNSLNQQEDSLVKGIGLKNIHDRIKLFYGAKYGLKIDSLPHIFTEVKITLPERF